MKKNNYFLASIALMGLSGGSMLFTSCQKDYNGELEIIRNQIKNGIVSLEELNNKITLINEQLTVLNQAIIDGDAENKAAIEKVISDLENIKKDLQGKIDALDGRIKANENNITDLKNDINAIEQDVELKLLKISERIDNIDARLNALDGRVQKLEGQVTALQEKYVLLDNAITGIEEEIKGLNSDMTDQKEKLETALRELEATKQILHNEIARLEGLMLKLYEINGEQHEALREEIADAVVEAKNYTDSKINNLTNQMGSFSYALGELRNGLIYINDKYGLLNNRLTGLEQTFNDQIAKVWEEIEKLKHTDDSKVQELQELVFALNEDLNSLRNDLNKQFADILNTQKLFGQRLDDVENIVKEHTEKLNKYDEKLKSLEAKVTKLETELGNLKDAYTKALTDIYQRLDNLESQGLPEASILKEQIKKMQEEMDRQAKAIKDLSENQQQQAENLVKLYNWANSSFLALKENAKQIGINTENIKTLQGELNKTNSAISSLTERVAKNESEIITIHQEIANLKEGQKGFITAEDVNNLLSSYYNKADIDKKLKDLLEEINTGNVNQDYVDKAVDAAKQELKGDIEKLDTAIKDLGSKLTSLEADVTNLINRIQSFVLLPDYNNSMIKVSQKNYNTYEMTLRVETTPKELVGQISNFKGIVSLRCQSVEIVSRNSVEQPKFEINYEGITTDKDGKLTIPVTIQGDFGPLDQDLPWMVAVELNNRTAENLSGSHKISEYKPLRLHNENGVIEEGVKYNFYNDGTQITTANAPREIHERVNLYVLQKIYLGDDRVTTINGKKPLFNGIVTANSTKNSDYTKLPVTYKLYGIYDNNENAKFELANSIIISNDGKISINDIEPIKNLDLTNYMVVVEMQAQMSGVKFGKPAYVCFSLQMEK